MRILLALIIAMGLAALLMYHYGGVKTFDPAEQFQEAKAAVQVGMTWQQVIDVLRPPKKFREIVLSTETVAGEKIEIYKPGPLMAFNREQFEDRLSTGRMAYGFNFEYLMSPDLGLVVAFDDSGVATSITDLPTIADLLQY